MRSKREERVNSAAGYLQDAAESLTACGSAPALYRKFLALPMAARKEAENYCKVREGPQMQAYFVRNCVLFSAFASEAYVNGFLAERLSGSDFDAVDRLPTVEKYVIGVNYSLGERLFERSREPFQSLKTLFELRNRFAHPKPTKGVVVSDLTPEVAAKLLVASARAGSLLTSRAKGFDLVSDLLSANAARVIGWGKQWTGNLPAFDAPEPPDLINRFARPWLEERLAEQTEHDIPNQE